MRGDLRVLPPAFEPCDYIQRIGRKVKMRTGGRVHWHIYKDEEKAKIMYAVYAQAIKDAGGLAL